MTRAMTPLQAVLRRVVKHARGNKLPDTSVYVIAQFAADHPIGSTHYDATNAAVGARYSRVIKRTKSSVRVEFCFTMPLADFEAKLAEARALPVTDLSRKVLNVALQVASDRMRVERRPPRRRQSSHPPRRKVGT